MTYAIADIIVGERRRDDMGDIAALAASIQRYGLLHPIVIDDMGRLVVGARRLQACRQLGWETVPTRSAGTLTEQELREIELEENERRKDLTPFERSKNLKERAALAEQFLAERRTVEVPEDVFAHLAQKGRGRPSKGLVPDDMVAGYLGVPRRTVEHAKAHVAAVETYPELEPLPQQPAIETAKVLDSLPEAKREHVRAELREQVKAEHATSQALLEQAGVYDDPEVQRTRMVAQLARAMKAWRNGALGLVPDRMALGLPSEDWESLRRLIEDTNAWMQAATDARRPTLQVVEG